MKNVVRAGNCYQPLSPLAAGNLLINLIKVIVQRAACYGPLWMAEIQIKNWSNLLISRDLLIGSGF